MEESKVFAFEKPVSETLMNISCWCRWCDSEFEIEVNRALLDQIVSGDPCVTCPNCKLVT